MIVEPRRVSPTGMTNLVNLVQGKLAIPPCTGLQLSQGFRCKECWNNLTDYLRLLAYSCPTPSFRRLIKVKLNAANQQAL